MFNPRRQGFPNGVDWWDGGGAFGQNGQKLHENYKTGIFGSKQWGVGWGRGVTSQFFEWWGDPPPLGETLDVTLIILVKELKFSMLIICDICQC